MKYFKRTDLIIITCILILSMAIMGIYSFLSAEDRVIAEIYYYSDLVEKVDLNLGENKTFSIPQEEDVILQIYPDSSIAFIKSDCADKVCIHTGKLNKTGQFAACLPNGIVVKIVPKEERDEDDMDLIISQEMRKGLHGQ
ncbi:MAG: NusG domain II-containing protein [Eubacteriales bacterium]|nr:NusG domain II-containing protein [Eubacteriales bacterium]MDD3198770.1 NusG domain II-containing protein [Eubacteriales bacterium]MDD4121439.1 NusG domain II-containing protein [Eubacteriales bacterium]MDD4628984.1 NusG domain II-containing protein [Eubacteriales bacterium]